MFYKPRKISLCQEQLVQFSSSLQNSKLDAALNQSHKCQFLTSSLRQGNSQIPRWQQREASVKTPQELPPPHSWCRGQRQKWEIINIRNKREGNKVGEFNAMMHYQPSACDATRREQTLSHFESRFLPWMWRRLEKLSVISLKVPARLIFSYSERCEVSYGSQEELTPQFTILVGQGCCLA